MVKFSLELTHDDNEFVYRPNTGLSSFDEEKSDLMLKYKKISRDEAGKLTPVFVFRSRNIDSCENFLYNRY